jgi:demethylspheroidene O-methyltransferase
MTGLPRAPAAGPLDQGHSMTKSGPGLVDRLYAWRDRLVMDPRFRRLAARFPLTRPLARKRAKTLFDLCAGFAYSQVLLAGVRLRLFRILEEGPADLDRLAARLDLPPESAERLLLAATALGLVARRGKDRFGLGELGAALLGTPGLEAMIEHHALLYADLADPVALLRSERPATALSAFWGYGANPDAAALGGERVAAYSRLMAATQPMIAAELLDAYPVGRHRRLLDVGGGEGAFLIRAAATAPDLELMLFDLPAVTARARQRLDAAGLGGRSAVFGGDFLTDPLPEGADLITLVRIIHDHDDQTAAAILDAARTALAPGGTLLLAEPMAGTPGAEAMADAYFGFYLLAMGKGRARRSERLFALLREAGFTDLARLPTATPLLTSVIRARPSS